MNLVGKIFTVFILVMAVTFAAFASAVYVTHRNWKDEAEKKSKELASARSEREVAQNKNKDLNQQLKDERDRQAKDVAKLENENSILRKERQKNEKSIAALEEKVREAVGAVNAAHKELANLRTRVTTLTEDIKTARIERDAQFKRVIELKDQLNTSVDELTRLQKRNEDVVKELAEALEALRYFGVNHKSDYKATRAPMGFKGHILAVQGNDVVEISGGSDMGLRKGHKLEVVRGSGPGAEYCGRIEVVQTAFDKSVCRIIKEMLRKPMQRGDNVLADLN